MLLCYVVVHFSAVSPKIVEAYINCSDANGQSCCKVVEVRLVISAKQNAHSVIVCTIPTSSLLILWVFFPTASQIYATSLFWTVVWWTKKNCMHCKMLFLCKAWMLKSQYFSEKSNAYLLLINVWQTCVQMPWNSLTAVWFVHAVTRPLTLYAFSSQVVCYNLASLSSTRIPSLVFLVLLIPRNIQL